MKLKTLIDFYPTCPMCQGNMVWQTDLSMLSTIDKIDNGLLVSFYEQEKQFKFKLNHQTNTIDADYPFIVNTGFTRISRAIHKTPSEEYDILQLESHCSNCDNFALYADLSFSHQTKQINPITIRYERAVIRKDNLVIKKDGRTNELVINPLKSFIGFKFYRFPFQGSLKDFPLDNPKKLRKQINKYLLLSDNSSAF